MSLATSSSVETIIGITAASRLPAAICEEQES
jgi:hypothetical protein